jgi:hypothetical protein
MVVILEAPGKRPNRKPSKPGIKERVDMDCLHCGDCCLRMSPLSAPYKCPLLIKEGTYFLCSDYENRPDGCKNHSFDSRFCPIGLSILKPSSIEEIRYRIDEGYRMICELLKQSEVL